METKRVVDGRNVCVIGGAGFLGSHLVEHLVKKRNCKVLVLDNLITGSLDNIYRDQDLKDNIRFVWYDIRDEEKELVRLLTDHDVQFVFNYAAEPYIPECFERPLHFFDINAVAVLRVLNACDEADVQAILQVSSAEIYGDAKGSITEDAKIEPHSTYGVSKVAADGLVQVRWREARVPCIALRQFNCVGERETHEYVIPEIISQLYRQVTEEQPTIYLGNNSNRDFMYAGDAVELAVELLENGNFGEVYNMGSETHIQIYDLAALIAELMGFTQPLRIELSENKVRPWEIWHLQSDNTKLYKVVDRIELTPLRKALAKTIKYYLNNGGKWSYEKP